MERRISVEPTSNATESTVCSRGWLRIVVAGARSAGFAFLMAGLVAAVPGVSPASAGQDGLTWVVTKASGNVQYRMGGKAPTEWQALQAGAVLGAAAEVRTGSDSRALLTHRGTTLTVSPESALKLPGADRPNGVYRVFQSLGTLLYKIKERAAGMAAFEVETPYLVAVVKGTVFTVNASNAGAAVHLTEGVVDVQPTLGGTGVTLTPGRTALITAVPGADVIVKGLDAGKRSNVTPSKGKGKGSAATSSGAHGGKGVTISQSAKSDHPRAVAIFASNNRGGLFAKGVNVKNAFNMKGGVSGSSHGGEVSAVARDLAINGGADVSAAAKDGGLALGTGNDGGGLSSNSGSGGGGLSSNSGSGGGGLSSSGSGGGGLSSGGSGGGGLSSGGSGGGGLSSSGSGGGGLSNSGPGNNNAGGLGGGNSAGNSGKGKGGGKKS